MFSFKLDESASLAKKLLSGAAGRRLDSWKSVVSDWRKSKAKLIDALDSDTARICWTPSADVDFDASSKRLAEALAEYGLGALTGNWDRAHQELPNNKLHADGAVVKWAQANNCKAIRPGQKLSRAFAAALIHQGKTPDEASAIVQKIMDAWRGQGDGKLVISANILDILLVSEHCSYTSCHKFDGQHCAGPQQYLMDSHTCVAYYYKETRNKLGEQLPYKTWRQMVHVNEHGAAFMRNYGTAISAQAHKELRARVASVVSILAGNPSDLEPKWFIKNPSDKEDNCLVINCTDNELAYIDKETAIIRLSSGAPLEFKLETPICAHCGDNELSDGGMLLCSDCDKGGIRCCACEELVDEEDARTYCDDTYCDSCFNDRFSFCECCSEDYPSDDTTHTCGVTVCDDCLSNNFTRCAACEDYFPDNNGRRFTSNLLRRYDWTQEGPDGEHYCDSCYSDRFSCCEKCDEAFDNSDLTDGVCEECTDKLTNSLSEYWDDCADSWETNLDTELPTWIRNYYWNATKHLRKRCSRFASACLGRRNWPEARIATGRALAVYA